MFWFSGLSVLFEPMHFQCIVVQSLHASTLAAFFTFNCSSQGYRFVSPTFLIWDEIEIVADTLQAIILIMRHIQKLAEIFSGDELQGVFDQSSPQIVEPLIGFIQY